MKKNREYMSLALCQAEKALAENEVPVGAVIVCGDKIIGTGYNKREGLQNALCHAEIEAINAACKALGSWRLKGCTMYVTLEPCPMCTGAIINSHIDTVVFGAYDEKAGCMGSAVNFTELSLGHTPKIIGGYMQSESQKLLSDFFARLRKGKN